MKRIAYSNYRRDHCGACGHDDVPMDLEHVPEICVGCAAALRDIDRCAANIRDIRKDMRAYGVPLSGATRTDPENTGEHTAYMAPAHPPR